jgi:hypothetical protein
VRRSGKQVKKKKKKKKKKFQDLSPGDKAATAALIGASLVVVAAAQRDIQRRPSSEIRGRPLLWRLISLNAIGALSYFLWGRRTPSV